jgi:hypothetical protein
MTYQIQQKAAGGIYFNATPSPVKKKEEKERKTTRKEWRVEKNQVQVGCD